MAVPENRNRRRDTAVGLALICCMGVVALWYAMAMHSRRAFDAFSLTAATFAGFSPAMHGSTVERCPVGDDPHEPNLAVYRFHSGAPKARTTLVRLVHGYNMRDCMRIKGFDVRLVEERREDVKSGSRLPRVQIWELNSSIGDRSIWATSMLGAPSLAGTDVDVRSMPFPRVGIPDELNWYPKGITWEGLKHPVRNTRRFLRAHWNKSRCDLRTALGWKRPAWLENSVLTLVTLTHDIDKNVSLDKDAVEHVLAVHREFHGQLVAWGRMDGPAHGALHQ